MAMTLTRPRSIALRDLPHGLRSLVEAELDRDERILWIGMPLPWNVARQALPILLFAIPWTGFALFWMAGASGFSIPDFKEGFDFFPLFGVPFVLIGLGMLGAPYWAMRKAKKTVYVLTGARAIVFEGGRSTRIRSFEPDQLNDLRRTQRQDGSGNLIFERRVWRNSDGNHRSSDHGFLGIPDVKRVEDLVRDMVEEHEAMQQPGAHRDRPWADRWSGS